jgi:hypothetical protein
VRLTTYLYIVPNVKNEWSYTSIPSLGVNRDNFTFPFLRYASSTERVYETTAVISIMTIFCVLQKEI